MKSILLLAANPKNTNSLRLQEEEREIKERLRLAGYGKVPINSLVAARTRDIQQAMLDFKPQIVHFSGHGSGQDGLIFEDINGYEKLVDSEALASLFKLFSKHVECVVLNACYSKFQAEAIVQHIKFVVGMSKEINDQAAIEFAVGFYSALGAGESIDFSYRLGCNSIQLSGIPEHLTPILLEKSNPSFELDDADIINNIIENGKLIDLCQSVNERNSSLITFTLVDVETGIEYLIRTPYNLMTRIVVERLLDTPAKGPLESPFVKNMGMYHWGLYIRHQDFTLSRIHQNLPIGVAVIQDDIVCELHAEIIEAYSTRTSAEKYRPIKRNIVRSDIDWERPEG
jgi:hypothetical protein